MTTPDDHREYIGDGVYATYDGWHIVLETQRGMFGDVEGGPVRHWIALDPSVFRSLLLYAARVENLQAPEQP